MKNFSKVLVSGLIVSMVLSVSGCAPKSSSDNSTNNLPPNDLINIYGSTSVEPLASALGEAYKNKTGNTEVIVQGIGSSEGIKAVNEGSTEIGTSSRELNDDEKDFGLKETVVAYDGIAVIINPENTVKNLTDDQVKQIFMGKITNWKQVGGKDSKIDLVNREEGSGTRGAFQELFKLEEKDASGKKVSLITQDSLIFDSTGAIKANIASTPNAIGYVSFAALDNTVKATSIDGVPATIKNVLNKTYKIQRPFLFLTKGTPNAKIQKFIDYTLSKAGQKIVEEKGFIPLAKEK